MPRHRRITVLDQHTNEHDTQKHAKQKILVYISILTKKFVCINSDIIIRLIPASPYSIF